MNAVILAGGKGTRLFPLTDHTPKPLVSFFGRPVLEHQIELLKRKGIDDIIITVGHLKQQIMDYFGDGANFGVRIRYVCEESPLGTAGGVKLAESMLSETFLVISGDAVTDAKLKAAIDFHRANRAAVTLILKEVDDPSQYGIAQMDEDNGHITRFLEKPAAHEAFSNTANTGMYIIERRCLALVPADRPFDFSKDLFPALLARQERLFGYRMDERYWNDIGSLSEYLGAHMDTLQHRVSLPLAERVNGVSSRAIVHPRAQVSEFAVVERDAYLDDGAMVGDFTFVGVGARIGAGVTLQRCVINEGCVIGAGSVLRDCVLSPGTFIPAHSVIQCGAIGAQDDLPETHARFEHGVVALARNVPSVN